LITAVLALQVFEARGTGYEFLPDLAFAIVLLSNVVLLGGTLRARSLPAIETEVAAEVASPELEASPEL
jgi:hypothetical protein